MVLCWILVRKLVLASNMCMKTVDKYRKQKKIKRRKGKFEAPACIPSSISSLGTGRFVMLIFRVVFWFAQANVGRHKKELNF